MDGKNINKVNVEAVEETGDETSTSLIYPKDGKWQRPLSACDSTTSDSSLSESNTDK